MDKIKLKQIREKILSSLPKKLKSLRIAKNYTQKLVAQKLDISCHAYGSYERRKALPTVRTIGKISSLYNVTVDYLLGND